MVSGRFIWPGLARLERLHHGSFLAGLRVSRLQLPLLLLLALLSVGLAYQRTAPLTLSVGPQDRRFIHDANEPELIADIGRWVRWTTAETRLDLPLVAAQRPLVLDLSLINSYPSGLPDPLVTITIGNERLTRLAIERPIEGVRRYRLLVPPQQPGGWSLPITLQSTTVVLAADPRPIGVMFAEAQLATLAGGPLLPPLWQVLAMLLCAAMSYFTLRGIGAARWWAWAGASLLVLSLAVGLFCWHLQVAPYTMRLAGLFSLGALYGLAVFLLTERQAPGTLRPCIAAARLPLLMGLAFWLMPAYQLVMTADGVSDVTPYPPTFWVGVVTLLCCLVAVGLLLDLGRLRHWQAVLLSVVACSALVHIVVQIDFALGRSGPDFWILFRGARDWLRGGSLYNLEAVQTNHFGHVFKVPPFYGMLFLPFVEQDGLTILFWHRVANIMLLAGTLLLLVRAFRVPIASALAVGLLLLFQMRPAADTIAYGQIDIALLLLLVVALVAAQRQQDVLAGAALALGTLFKLYPALLLVFFVVRRRWWALAGFAAAMLVCNAVAIAVVGWEMHRVYLFEVVPRIGGGTSWVENQTLNGFLSRLAAPGITSDKFDHPLVGVLTYAGFLLALGGAVLLMRRPADLRSPRFVLQFSIFIILMVLAVPAAWMHYQTITILPFFGVLLYSTEQGRLPRGQAALLGIAYALVAYGNQWSFYTGHVLGGLTVLGVSYKFYGQVLLLSITAACLLELKSQQN